MRGGTNVTGRNETLENLNEGFAGESQANRRYLYFARQADVEGYPDTAGVFRSTAEGETGHAFGHIEFMEEVGDPATGEAIGDTEWYPFDTFERMGVAIINEIADGDMEAVRLWGKSSINDLLGLHKDLVSGGDPAETLMRFQVLRKTFFDFSAIDLLAVSENDARFRIAFDMCALAEEAATYQALGFFETLLEAAGANPVPYPYKLRCCGGALMVTNRQAALQMTRDVLRSAVEAGADVIATACPLCQTNLECYQEEVNRAFDTSYAMPILYFTQLLGLALGIGEKRLGIGKELVSAKAVLRCSPAATVPADT